MKPVADDDLIDLGGSRIAGERARKDLPLICIDDILLLFCMAVFK